MEFDVDTVCDSLSKAESILIVSENERLPFLTGLGVCDCNGLAKVLGIFEVG